MTHFDKRIDIEAPPERVWPVMFDVDRWSEWTASITRVEKLDPGPLHVGSRARVHQPKLLPALWSVTEVKPGRSFTWVSRAPGALVTASHSVEPIGSGCRATLVLDYSGPLGSLLARLFRGITERYLDMEARGLKQACEELAKLSQSSA